MSENRLNVDSDIDRALASLLSAEPSPAFAAGVRARSMVAPVTLQWRRWAMAAAAGLLVAVVGPSFRPSDPTIELAFTARDVALPIVPLPVLPTDTRPGADPRRVGARHVAAAPEIVTDPALGRDLERLLRLGAGQDGGALAAASTLAAAQPPNDLAVMLVTVEELTVPAIAGGARR